MNLDNKRKVIKITAAAAITLAAFAFLYYIGDSLTYTNESVKKYFIRAVCAALIAGLAADKDFIPPQTKQIISYAVTAAAPIAIAAGVMIIPDISYLILNVLILYIIYIPLLLVIRKSAPTVVITAVLVYVCTFANELLLSVRGMPLTIPDFGVLSTATTVAARYKYIISIELMNSLVTAFALCVVAVACNFSFKNYSVWLKKLGCVILIATEILFAAGAVKILKTQSFNPYKCGVFYNLADGLIADRVNAPDGYSEEKIEKIMSSYPADKADDGDKPNIIMIMDESFSDPTEEADITTNEPIMPFYDSMKKNTLKGRAVVSVYGGGTSNSEYEFLTGLSMSFLPNGSYPYQQYIKNDLSSIADDFNSDEYEKIYLHPYNGANYNRDKVWKHLGFDKFMDIDSFEGSELIRGYVSDKAAFDKLIENFNNKPEGKKSLQFMVTIQNHSPYNYQGDDFEGNIKANEVEDKELNQYLTLIKHSDDAIKYIVDYFSKVDEKTAIIYFGDHRAALKALKTFDKSNESPEIRYEVPYFIWTNYNTADREMNDISINYLSLIVKQQLGLPLSSLDKVRSELMKKYPVLTKQVCLDDSGKETEPKSEDIMPYSYICYHNLFDNK